MDKLKNAERLDNFLELCRYNFFNTYVRKDNIYKPDINQYYNTIKLFINQNNLNVEIIQLHPSAENGFPHTRPNNIICIPSTARFPSLMTTIFHELVHVHQRNNLDVWTNFLHDENWFEVDETLIPERWKEKIRYNPDTIYSAFWAFENRYVPLPIFINLNNPRFNDVKVMFYDLESGILEHDAPQSFKKKYGDNRQTEHVFEIYAVLLENDIQGEEDINYYLKNR